MKLETLLNIRGGTPITRLSFYSGLGQDRETLRSANMLSCANRNISRTVLIITASWFTFPIFFITVEAVVIVLITNNSCVVVTFIIIDTFWSGWKDHITERNLWRTFLVIISITKFLMRFKSFASCHSVSSSLYDSKLWLPTIHLSHKIVCINLPNKSSLQFVPC